MSRLVTCTFLLLFCFSSYSAESISKDELLKRADQIKSSNNQEFSKIMDDLRLASSELTVEQINFFLYLSGYQNAYQGNVTKAIALYKQVESETSDIALKFRVSLSLVNLYALTKEWLEGFTYLDNISRLNREVSDPDIRHQGLIIAAVFYNELEQYEMSQVFVRQLLAEKVSGRNRCLTYSVKLKADLATGNFESLEQETLDTIKTCSRHDELVVVNVLRTYLGTYYLSQNRPQQLISLLKHRFQEIIDSNYQLLIVNASSLLAKAYLALKDFPNAEKYALVVANIENNRYLETLTSAYKVLAASAKQRQNFDLAFNYQSLYIKSTESLFEQTKAKQLAVESAKHRAAEKDNQIALLNKQNEMLQLQEKLANETAENNRLFVYLMIVIVASLALWGYNLKRTQIRLRKLAEFDSLTGLNNRRHFSASAERLLSYCEGESQEACFIMFDLDKFKQINDTYGHIIGDQVLRDTANAIKKQGRKNDLIGRIGGEEFAIMLPACGIAEGEKIAEQYREAIEAIDISNAGHRIKITASFGVTHSRLSSYELKQLIRDSDTALYQAKDSGRNRVVCYQA